ncbi:hypothetical protein TNCV_834181 [Trichonephila clavipes]|nr:hypothetical protein TNCV_834181 [Trichonephila clavipes]
MTSQHYATTHKDSFSTKSVDVCYVEGIQASLFSGEMKTRPKATLSGGFHLITEKNMDPLVLRQRRIFSSPLYPVFLIGCSQNEVPDRRPGNKFSFCKMLAWKLFFLTQLQGHMKADESFSTYVVVPLILSYGHVHISMLFGDFVRPSCCK